MAEAFPPTTNIEASGAFAEARELFATRVRSTAMQGRFDYSADLHQSLLLRNVQEQHLALWLGEGEADVRNGNIWTEARGYVRRPLSVPEKLRRKFLHTHVIPPARSTRACIRPHDTENCLGALPRERARLLLLHTYAARREVELAKLDRDDLPYEERMNTCRILDALEGYYRAVAARVLRT